MLDWDGYRQELLKRIVDLGRLTPETVRGYRELSDAGSKTAHLDAKTRELIALAVGVTRQCDGCITTHVHAARQAGATAEDPSTGCISRQSVVRRVAKYAAVAHPQATALLTASGNATEYLSSHAPAAAPANMVTTDAVRRAQPGLPPPASVESAARPASVSVRTVVVRLGTASVLTVAFRTPIARPVRMMMT